MRPQGTAAALEARRPRAADLLAAGMKPEEVARQVGAGHSSVKKWSVRSAIDSGIESLGGQRMRTTLRNWR